MGPTCILEIVSNYPFTSTGQAIAFYTRHNPARMKAINLLEPEVLSTGSPEYSEDALFAAVALARNKVLRAASKEERAAFLLRNAGDRITQWAVEDIAKYLHRSEQTIYRYLAKLMDELEQELIHRGLLEAQKQEKSSCS